MAHDVVSAAEESRRRNRSHLHLRPPSFAPALQVISNSRALAAALVARGYVMATGGTDNHLVLWDLRPLGLTGSKLEKLCDEVRMRTHAVL